MKPLFSIFGVLAVLAALFLLNASCYTVDMREQVIITQFQKVVGAPVTEPGLHFKAPFIQTANSFSKQVLEWDGPSVQMPTKDKVYIVVDTFGRWKIVDALLFMQKLRDERAAHSRITDLLGSETRSVVAKHDLIEVVRTTKDRVAARDASLTGKDAQTNPLPKISFGRTVLEKEIFANAKEKVKSFGIELLDVRFKRINYNRSISGPIHERMIAERQQIAEGFRSQGAGDAAEILGNRDKELKEIESKAYKQIQEIEGAADAKATEIYAKAYNSTPEAVKLFEFTKAMDTLKKSITPDTTMILTTDGDLMRHLKSAEPPAAAKPDLIKGLNGLPSLLDVK